MHLSDLIQQRERDEFETQRAMLEAILNALGKQLL